jgi:hypothetical protein
MSYPKTHIASVGGLFTRVMVFENAGDVETGHTHQFDHATLVAHGSVLVRCRGKETVFKAPQLIWIAAELEHELVSQEANTVCACLHTIESRQLVTPTTIVKSDADIVAKDMIPLGAEEAFAARGIEV